MASNRVADFCSVEGCQRQICAKGLCRIHRTRLIRTGRLDTTLNVGWGANRTERFWSRVDKTPGQGPKGDCWEWRGSVTAKGYGSLSFEGRLWGAHRLAWLLVKGEAPSLCLLHKCDNPICVRVDHLREGTQQDNIADMMQKKRNAFGEKSGGATISEQMARQVKRLVRGTVPQVEIARILGVSRYVIAEISSERAWRHVEV